MLHYQGVPLQDGDFPYIAMACYGYVSLAEQLYDPERSSEASATSQIRRSRLLLFTRDDSTGSRIAHLKKNQWIG